MEKVIRDCKVAILYSPGFGAGWYTWNLEHKELIFHPKLVEMVERGDRENIDSDWIEKNIGFSGVYCGGASDLEIEWIDEGTRFRIDEYDGSESVMNLYTDESIMTA